MEDLRRKKFSEEDLLIGDYMGLHVSKMSTDWMLNVWSKVTKEIPNSRLEFNHKTRQWDAAIVISPDRLGLFANGIVLAKVIKEIVVKFLKLVKKIEDEKFVTYKGLTIYLPVRVDDVDLSYQDKIFINYQNVNNVNNIIGEPINIYKQDGVIKADLKFYKECLVKLTNMDIKSSINCLEMQYVSFGGTLKLDRIDLNEIKPSSETTHFKPTVIIISPFKGDNSPLISIKDQIK